MTDEECIALALLHGPSTVETGINNAPTTGTHDPIQYNGAGQWWVYRNDVCAPNFNTRGEASRHYCKVYGLLPPEVA